MIWQATYLIGRAVAITLVVIRAISLSAGAAGATTLPGVMSQGVAPTSRIPQPAT